MGQYLMNFSEDLHRAAKVRAAQEGITLKALIEKVLKEYLKTAKKKGAKS